jgi:heme-degrading monooxygenase HmoA
VYVKWIVCQVEESRRPAFDGAQRTWAVIATTAGFVAQVGGWTADGTEACIVAFWADRGAYDRYVAYVHDAVTSASGQEQTYTGMEIVQASMLVRMRGAAASIAAAAGEAGFLRVADCRVPRERRGHFVNAQISVWEPGMAKTQGQLGGAFAVIDGADGEDDDRYLVTTLWHDEAAHRAYVTDVQPGLREQARPDEDLRGISGRTVQLERGWTVLGAV